MNTFQTIEQMRQSPYVKEKELLNGISSFNFTRKAFWDRHWTAATVKARGLFIDTEQGRIKARSFDKFFTIGERRETKLDILAENFEYPVKAYVKYNGYLGICTGEPDGKGGYRLWCASKSTDQGWYAARFEDLLREALQGKCKYTNETKCENFCRTLYENNYTAIFEVVRGTLSEATNISLRYGATAEESQSNGSRWVNSSITKSTISSLVLVKDLKLCSPSKYLRPLSIEPISNLLLY